MSRCTIVNARNALGHPRRVEVTDGLTMLLRASLAPEICLAIEHHVCCSEHLKWLCRRSYCTLGLPLRLVADDRRQLSQRSADYAPYRAKQIGQGRLHQLSMTLVATISGRVRTDTRFARLRSLSEPLAASVYFVTISIGREMRRREVNNEFQLGLGNALRVAQRSCSWFHTISFLFGKRRAVLAVMNCKNCVWSIEIVTTCLELPRAVFAYCPCGLSKRHHLMM